MRNRRVIMADTSSSTADVTPKSTWLLPEGIVIALVPALAYAIALLYEVGFAGYFSIPISLIDVDLSSFVISLFSLLIVTIVLFFIANLFFMLWPANRREYITYFYPLLLWVLFMVAMFAVRREFLPVLRSTWMILIFIILYYLVPIIEYRKEKKDI